MPMSKLSRRNFVEMAIALGATAAWGRSFGSRSKVTWRERRVRLRVPGAHNAVNAAGALEASGGDFKLLTQRLKERTGRKGAELFMPLRVALTGQAHGPELAPLFALMPPAIARRRLESHACS